MRLILLSICLSIAATFGAQAQSCILPEEPYEPSQDEDFSAYADMVAMDYETYFSDLTAYFRCIDEEREAVLAQARDVSKKRDAFWARAKRLGLTEDVAIDHPPINGEVQRK